MQRHVTERLYTQYISNLAHKMLCAHIKLIFGFNQSGEQSSIIGEDLLVSVHAVDILGEDIGNHLGHFPDILRGGSQDLLPFFPDISDGLTAEIIFQCPNPFLLRCERPFVAGQSANNKAGHIPLIGLEVFKIIHRFFIILEGFSQVGIPVGPEIDKSALKKLENPP